MKWLHFTIFLHKKEIMKINWKKARQNIPNRVKLKSRKFYEILWIAMFPTDKHQYGETRFPEKQILLNTEQSDRQAVLTAVHEFWHALSYEKEIGLTETQVIKLEESYEVIEEFFSNLRKD